MALEAYLVEPFEGANVLEIGTGYGFSGAVMINLIGDGKLTTIEWDDVIAPKARKNLARYLTRNFGSIEGEIEVIEGDGSIGYLPNAPYDRIYFAVGPDKKTFDPGILLAQLNNNGILLYPPRGTNTYVRHRKIESEIMTEIFDIGMNYIPLKGKNK